MKEFTLFWLTGNSEVIKGTDIADAFRRAGYGEGALRALDFYSAGNVANEHVWDKENRTWNSTNTVAYE